MKIRFDRLAASLLLVISFTAAAAAQASNEGYLVTPDKVKICYKIEGSGSDTLVVVHGGPGNSLESVRPDFVPLATNRRVIYYDQRGQGRSELLKDGKRLGYKQHVADLEAVRQHFKLEKMTLLGNSWGGLLASLYAVAYPDRIERLILDSPASPSAMLMGDMEEEISRRMAKIYTPEQIARTNANRDPAVWLKSKDPITLCRETYTSILRTYTYTQSFDFDFKGDLCAGGVESVRQQRTTNAHAWRSLGDFDLMPRLGAVKAPVLVIHGVADVISLRSSEHWAYGYPNARLFVIEKAGHMAQVEAPAVFFPAIETFLKGNFPDTARKVESVR